VAKQLPEEEQDFKYSYADSFSPVGGHFLYPGLDKYTKTRLALRNTLLIKLSLHCLCKKEEGRGKFLALCVYAHSCARGEKPYYPFPL